MQVMETESKNRLAVSVSSAVFIEDMEGKLLLVQQASVLKGHKWGPPAGGMKAGEDPMMAALREVKEEVGVEVELERLLGIYTVDRGLYASGIGFVFRGRITRGEIKMAEGEIMNYGFFSRKEVLNMIEDGLIYKPEYNLQSVEDWINNYSYPPNVIRRLIS